MKVPIETSVRPNGTSVMSVAVSTWSGVSFAMHMFRSLQRSTFLLVAFSGVALDRTPYITVSLLMPSPVVDSYCITLEKLYARHLIVSAQNGHRSSSKACSR